MLATPAENGAKLDLQPSIPTLFIDHRGGWKVPYNACEPLLGVLIDSGLPIRNAPNRTLEQNLALFGKKKAKDEGGAANPEANSDAWRAEPEKAEKFFQHARTVAATSNFSYALTLFARGLRFDPKNMAAHQAIYETGIRYFQTGGKSASGKEIKEVDGPNPVDKMAAAEFAWTKDINNLALAMKLMNAVGKAGQDEYGKWLAPRLLAMMRKAKKQNKSMYVQGKDLFASVNAWDEAFASAEQAVAIDPSDNELLSELNELSAQRAISAAGFDKENKEGDFRRNIRGSDEQKAREDAESLSGGASAERTLDRAREAFEANPASPDEVNKYGQLLRRRDTEEDDNTAAEVYMKGFESTGQYRFRMNAGDVKMGRIRKKIRSLTKDLPEGETTPEIDDLNQELRELRSLEYNERVKKYPTDRGIRFELGLIEFERNNYEDAMSAFQQCKDEAKYRTRATHMLGCCFVKEGWHQEAVGEFREALEKLESAEKERELPIRYDLMHSLIDLARETQSRDEAREAAEICSAILRKDIGYRDIRKKRKEVDALIKEIEG